MEPQPDQPTPDNNYQFIMDPSAPKKPKLLKGLGGNSFVTKIVLIVGGAVALIIVLTVAVNIFFGDKTSTETFIGISQIEQEIVRLSAEGENASTPEIKNAAINTQLSVKSQQLEWLTFLGKHGVTLNTEILNLKKDASTDTKLQLAEQTSTFDTTYTTVMLSQLEDYTTALTDAYEGSTGEARQLLSDHYNEVGLLLEQWPTSTLGLAGY